VSSGKIKIQIREDALGRSLVLIRKIRNRKRPKIYTCMSSLFELWKEIYTVLGGIDLLLLNGKRFIIRGFDFIVK